MSYRAVWRDTSGTVIMKDGETLVVLYCDYDTKKSEAIVAELNRLEAELAEAREKNKRLMEELEDIKQISFVAVSKTPTEMDAALVSICSKSQQALKGGGE